MNRNPELLDREMEHLRSTLDGALDDGKGPWVVHPLSELLPHPSPLTWSLVRHLMSGDGGYGRMLQRLGYEPAMETRYKGILDDIGGRIYVDLSRAPNQFFPKFPWAYDEDDLVEDPDLIHLAPTRPRSNGLRRAMFRRRLNRAEDQVFALAGEGDENLREEVIPQFEQWVHQQKAKDLSLMTAYELRTAWQRCRTKVLEEFASQGFLPTMCLATIRARLRTYCEEKFRDQDPEELVTSLGAGGRASHVLHMLEGLQRVSSGELTAAAWLNLYGHRGVGEMELAMPRWREDPEEVERMAAMLRDTMSPLMRQKVQAGNSERLLKSLRPRLNGRAYKRLVATVDLFRRYVPYHEDARHYFLMGWDLFRDLALEAGRRLGIDEGVFLLEEEELFKALERKQVSESLIERRRTQYETERDLYMPPMISRDNVDTVGLAPKLPEKERLRVRALAFGDTYGPVIRINPEALPEKPKKGSILVCTGGDIHMAPLFTQVGGLVFEGGGSLSYGAGMARSLGVPAVVLHRAGELLTDGETVSLNPGEGVLAPYNPKPSKKTPRKVRLTEEVDREREANIAARPPSMSRYEWVTAGLAGLCLVGWGLLALLVKQNPAANWITAAVRGTGAACQPLIDVAGRPGGVAMLGVVLAVIGLIVKGVGSDVRNLREARGSMKRIRKENLHLRRGSLQWEMVNTIVRPVRLRVLLAWLMPLLLLAGPFALIVTWLARAQWDLPFWAPVARLDIGFVPVLLLPFLLFYFLFGKLLRI